MQPQPARGATFSSVRQQKPPCSKVRLRIRKYEMKRSDTLRLGLVIGALLTAGVAAQNPTGSAASPAAAAAPAPKDWQAPDISKLPDDKYGQMVRQGKALMEETYKYIGPEVGDVKKRYAGNNLACVSCHVESGGRKFGNPWVGTFASFPQYRGREDAVSTTEERINGCMERMHERHQAAAGQP